MYTCMYLSPVSVPVCRYYLVLTSLLMVGFSLWGQYLYGPYMHRFKSITESFFQLVRWLLGDFG